ncbi:hypothetical protein AN401_08165 [Zobellella denitrificans]|uniref:Uncharacterized protein n=1 Tax=Zobellella denitrificans TaxID=347534 RepID=A0A291HP03_9GAMM|nr:hypothetical protein AN401_08165 [Zobellella denitrificans]
MGSLGYVFYRLVVFVAAAGGHGGTQAVHALGTYDFQVFQPDFGMAAFRGCPLLNLLDKTLLFIGGRRPLTGIQPQHGMAALLKQLGFRHRKLAATTQPAREVGEVLKRLG